MSPRPPRADRFGSRLHAPAAELDAIDPDWLVGTHWLHAPLYGFAQPASGAALLGAAHTVRAAGARISLDLSSVAVLRSIGPQRLRAERRGHR